MLTSKVKRQRLRDATCDSIDQRGNDQFIDWSAKLARDLLALHIWSLSWTPHSLQIRLGRRMARQNERTAN